MQKKLKFSLRSEELEVHSTLLAQNLQELPVEILFQSNRASVSCSFLSRGFFVWTEQTRIFKDNLHHETLRCSLVFSVLYQLTEYSTNQWVVTFTKGILGNFDHNWSNFEMSRETSLTITDWSYYLFISVNDFLMVKYPAFTLNPYSEF